MGLIEEMYIKDACYKRPCVYDVFWPTDVYLMPAVSRWFKPLFPLDLEVVGA